MGSFVQEHWPRLQAVERSPFSGDCALVSSELWHDRPTAEVHRFVVDHGGRQVAYYWKRHKLDASGAESEYQTLVKLSEHFTGREDLGVVEPVALVEPDAALVTVEFAGTDLRAMVRRGIRYGASAEARREAAAAVRAAALFVREMQQSEPPETRDYDLEPLLAWVSDDLGRCLETGMLDGALTAQARLVLGEVRRGHAAHESVVVVANSDTKLWNFLIGDGGELRALDFVGIQKALPTHDFARLWVGLDWQRIFPQSSGAAVDDLQRVLVEALEDYPLFDPHMFRFHRLCQALRAATFATSIRGDRYRRKWRNVIGFPLIRRYYQALIGRCLASATATLYGRIETPPIETLIARVSERAGDYFEGLDAPVEIAALPFSHASTYPIHKFSLRGAGGVEREIVVKIAPSFEDNDEARTEYRNLERLAPALAAADAGVCAPHALDYIADLDAVITEFVPHERLSNWMLSANRHLAPAATVTRLRDLSGLAGKLLSLIHAETAAGEVTVADSDLLPSFWAFLELAYEHGLDHEVCDKVARLLADLPTALAGLSVPRALAHGDYAPQNLGIAGDKLVVFDVQRRVDRVIYNDIAYYLVTLETLNPLPRYPLFSRRRAMSLGADFIAGYFGGEVTRNQTLALHFHYLKHLIQRLHKQSVNIARSGSWVRREAFERGWLRRSYPAAITRELEIIETLVPR